MSTFRKSRLSKFASVFLGIAIAVVMVMPGSASAQTAAELQAQIASLLATINSLQAQLSGLQGGTGTSQCSYTFTQNFSMGDSGAEVKNLQMFLNMDPLTRVAASGAGSPGNETEYFGSLTKSAVIKFQNQYSADILAPVGLNAGTGYWGPSSRAKANALCASTPGTPGTPGTTVPGSSLAVGNTSQPANSLAPQSAARIPFTKFTLTAGTDGDITVNSVTVERSGLANDAVFAGIVLLDENGIQIGNAKTLNSNHQANVGEPFVVKAGTSRTFTVAGNMASSLSSYAGQVAGISVVGVNTSATVSGSLPISGAAHTINATLSLGSATLNVSSFDPNTSQTKEIGTTGVRFAGIRMTAGSAEDVRLHSVRWNQTGSAGTADIKNVKVVVDGVEYATTVSSDGKYYTVTFGSGLVVPKGNNIDVYVKGDVVDGPNRTVFFDINKNTDVYLTGETFGYGITPSAGSTTSASDTSSQFTTGTPFFDGSKTTISAGSASTIQKSASSPAQRIAVNVPNQPLGAFEADFKGEAVTISGLTLTIASTTGSGYGLLTNVTIVDENGSVVAGPVDGVYVSASSQTATFSDSITFPTGKHTYFVKGKVASTIGNGGTYTVAVDPSAWSNPVGDTTGNTISLSSFGSFDLNTMTVDAASLAITVSPSPAAQNIVAGVQGYTFANYQFDASQSGEDVRFSSIPLKLSATTVAATDVTACQLFDGSTALNTGSNVVNPSATGDNTFTLDNSYVVPKGTVKTLSLKCNLSSSVSSGSLRWGISSSPSITVTGATSSNDVTETVTASDGSLMTVATGSLVASEDASSPSYAIVAAGTTNVTMGVINFRASNEDVTLQRVGLTLTNTASSSASDVVKVSLWDGATKVGEATFTGSSDYATSTDMTVVVPKDSDKDITVKVDLANIGTSEIGTQGALIAVDVDTNGTNTQGVGSGGTTINATGSTSFSGVRMFKSYPTITKQSIPSSTLIAGDMDLYRFSVGASAGGNGIGLHQLTVNVATSTGSAVSGTTTVTSLKVYAYTDSGYSTPVSGFTNGQVVATISGLVSSGDNDAQLSSILQIPAGATYYFRVVGTVTMTAGTGTFSGSVTTKLGGDTAYPSLAGLMGTHSTVDGNASGDNLVWSPNATTTSLSTHLDWTNGYFVSGLPSTGSDAVTISK